MYGISADLKTLQPNKSDVHSRSTPAVVSAPAPQGQIHQLQLLSALTLDDVLHILKPLYKHRHLQFVSHIFSKEDDYAIDHALAAEMAIHDPDDELVSSGNMEELWDMLNNMDATRTQF